MAKKKPRKKKLKKFNKQFRKPIEIFCRICGGNNSECPVTERITN